MNLNGSVCMTDGSGFWSKEKRPVGLDCCEVENLSFKGKKYGELRVYFDKNMWNTEKHGLIYTDKQFIKDLRILFQKHGFTVEETNDLNYSEQGMQGDDYVSLDVGEKFINAYDQVKD